MDDCSVMVENKVVMTGVGLKRTGIAVIVLGGLLYRALGGVDSDNPTVLFAAPLMMMFGVLVYFSGRQQAARVVAESSSGRLGHSKPDVLYLRSFKSDPATSFKKLISGFTTEEEQLVASLR
jgi:hypothetical protein